MRPRVAVWLLLAACAFPVDVGGVVGCKGDEDCGASRLCIGGTCVECPLGCVVPLNQQALRRNDCTMCDFAPASQCEGDAWCASGSCFRGARCASGCSELSCCANVCASSGCTGDAPLGCNVPCITEPGCATCIASKCRCGASGWECVATCTDPGFDAGCSAVAIP